MILSIDDGCSSDVKAAELAARYEIETIFYWPVDWHLIANTHDYEPLTYVQAKQIARDFEIGSHTITHPHLTRIPQSHAMWEIMESKLMLEELFDREITKFCPPRGYTNKELTDFTLSLYESQRLTKGKGLVHIHPESGVNDNKPWRECINSTTQEIWGHSWEIDRFNLWDELEEVLREYASS